VPDFRKGVGTTVSSILLIIILLMFMLSYVNMVNDNVKTTTYLNLDEAAMLRIENTFYTLNTSIGMTWFISTVQTVFHAGDTSVGCGFDEGKQPDPTSVNNMKEGYWYQGKSGGKPGDPCASVMPVGIKYNQKNCNPMMCIPTSEHLKNYMLEKMKQEYHDIKLELNGVNNIETIQVAELSKDNINTEYIINDNNVQTGTKQKLLLEDSYGTKITTETENNVLVKTYMEKMRLTGHNIVLFLFSVSNAFPTNYMYTHSDTASTYTDRIKDMVKNGIRQAEDSYLKNPSTGDYWAKLNIKFNEFKLASGIDAELVLHYDGLITIIEDQKPTNIGNMYEWPTGRSKNITRCFGPGLAPAIDSTSFHPGIDIEKEAISMTTTDYIYAVGDGEVIALEKDCVEGDTNEAKACGDGYGNFVLLEHDDDYYTFYAHMDDVSVDLGDGVDSGDRIGEMGNTGASTKSHLHFETRKGGLRLDPCGVMDCSKSTGAICHVITFSEDQDAYYNHDKDRNRFVKRPFTLSFGFEDYHDVLECSYAGAPSYEMFTWGNTNDMACCGGDLWVCCNNAACTSYPVIEGLGPFQRVPSGTTISAHDPSNHCNFPVRCVSGTFIFP